MKKEKSMRILPLLPLRGLLVFPKMILHFDVGRDKSIEALEEAMVADEKILLVAQKDARVDFPMPEDIYATGTVAKIKQLLKMPGDTIRVMVEGLNRARIEEYIKTEPFFKVRVTEILEDDMEISPEEEALMRSTMNLFENYAELNHKVSPEALISIGNITNPGRFADAIASHLNLKIEDKQKILETVDVKERLNILFEILTREIEILELEKKINNRVKKQLEKSQKEFYLREQIKAIQQELGEQDEKTQEANEYRKKIKALNLPDDLEQKVLKEVERLERTPPVSAEVAVIRNYLEWIVALPWNNFTEDVLDVKSAQEVLNEGHYGLERVKERILEFLAVRKLAGAIKSPILCFVGPPGVGKTSLAKSIAKAMGRKFVRVSLGGVRDEAEIRGHRRTYVGALPGRIIQGIRQAGTKNPVFLLDEVDKMSSDFRGDPTAALLEVLDPEQNHSFSDHYIELPFDLSKVLFIATANTLFNIPRPLLDRMEVISIPGYTEYEKLQIAKFHLIPRQLEEHGLNTENLVFSDEAVIHIIRNYTREAGVRNLEREIAGICRKVAKSVVEGEKRSVDVDVAMVEKFLGAPKFRYGVIEETDQIGVATGLAWTEMGGDILSVEATVMKGKGKLILTGKLGDVMQESAHAGYTYIRSRAAELGIDEDFHEKYDVHIHVPEGAIPKDGPSAGITMACALVSALSGLPVDRTVAMTGEITLRGRVLPVGGIKEKVLAAHRAGIKTVILPEENIKDLEEVPQNVKEDLCFVFVKTMDEVIKRAIKPMGNGITPIQQKAEKTNGLFISQ
ncbi:MAG: ATP-dependent Lon protease [Tepidanaerobacteraceae bacterium]|nr:ATP-dependent Lon protease [Tepidanaerobacteraceae bacterium]